MEKLKELKKLVIASHNDGKVIEIRKMLAPYGIEVVSAKELNLPDVEETGETFEQNACLKARTLAQESGLFCLADDSGLCVDALDGRPGVYSARYAPNRDFEAGMDMLLEELAPHENRSAHFSCVLALGNPNGIECQIFEGRVDGIIADEKHGENGFGYDKIFIPTGYARTFGEFSAEEKAGISHRGRAFEKFVSFLK